MSLINRMLKDLEQRRGDGGDVFAGAKISAAHGGGAAGPSRVTRLLAAGIVFVLIAATILVMRHLWRAQATESAPSSPAAATMAAGQVEGQVMPEGLALDPTIAADGSLSVPAVVLEGALKSPVMNEAAQHGLAATSDTGTSLEAGSRPRSLMQELSLHLYTAKSAQPVTPTKPRSSPQPQAARDSTNAALADAQRADRSRGDSGDGGGMRRTAKPERTNNRESRVSRLVSEARQAISVGKFDYAEAQLEKALQMAPTRHSARETLVALQIDRGRFDDAHSVALEGLTIDPNHGPYLVLLARVLIETGYARQASETLDAITGKFSGSIDVLSLKGAAYQRAGRHQDAVRAYRSLLRAQPENASAWIGIGISQESLADGAAAADAFRKALSDRSLSPSLQRFARSRIAAIERGSR